MRPSSKLHWLLVVICDQVGYNWFEQNNEHAIRIVPLLNAVGRIANNTFVKHSRYVLLLDNGDDLLDERYYQSTPVRYQVICRQSSPSLCCITMLSVTCHWITKSTLHVGGRLGWHL